MARTFFQMLNDRWEKDARVCIGLDPDPDKVTEIEGRDWVGDFEDIVAFNKEIIDATQDIALAYKPNAAFYTNSDDYILHETLQYLRNNAPDVPVIFDGKRGDIGNTNKGYVAEAFDIYPGADEPGFDAITIHNYLGMEANLPFLDQKERGIVVLCKTSNPGSGEFQDLIVEVSDTAFNEIAQTLPADHDGISIPKRMPLYQYVAWRSRIWNRKNNNVMLVVGATYPDQLKEVRRIVGDMPILIPGYGKQGGDLEASVRNGANSLKRGFVINESSSAIFASMKPDFAQACRTRVIDTTKKINAVLATL